jgi:uncharacterized protein with NRDE domain
MCLVVVALDRHPAYRLVIVSNRDEFHDRPSTPVAWWEERILAGRDLKGGGTWLGISPTGRWALVTNYRDGTKPGPESPSRGQLVLRALADPAAPAETLAAIAPGLPRYGGCNLLAGDLESLAYASNRGRPHQSLAPGQYALSNALLDAPWPKVRRTAARVEHWIARSERSLEPLFEALADTGRAEDRELPSTGIPLELERMLSSPFIVGERYGTRCSTVVTVDRSGRATLVERSFGPNGIPLGETTHAFRIEG